MLFESYLKELQPKINRELELFFPKNFSDKWLVKLFGDPEFGFDLVTLDESIAFPVWDFLGRGGKRWRPALMVLCCEAVGGSQKTALPFSVIPELLHSGTIIIDDFEDSTELRRGKPAMHKLFGNDIAVNNGTLLYYLPMAVLFRHKSIPAMVKSLLYDIYAEEMLKLSFGQGMDIFWHHGKKKKVLESDYLQMCSFKTGTLARLSAKFGAVLGGANSKTVDLLGDFAGSVGVAFQIQDDILNLSEKKSLGKEFAEDIHEGKRSLMVIHALNHASRTDAERLLEILSMHTSDGSLKREAIRILEKYDSFGYAHRIARGIVDKSWGKVEPCLKPCRSKEILCDFAGYVVERKS